MKITYTGRQVDLSKGELAKIEAKFGKVAKLLDGRDEREAHVVLSQERRQHKAEVIVRYHDNQLTGSGAGPDLFTACHGAIEKLEKQAIKVRTKWRDTKRTSRTAAAPVKDLPLEVEAPPASEKKKRIYRITNHARRKPITLDEAMMEMEKDLDYLVYRDASTERTSVLVRRRDGNFDLVEG